MPEETLRGFILQPSYRIEGGRPVVHLWGRLEGGDTFLIRDRRLVPHFYVRRADAERARRLGAANQRPSERRGLDGAALVRVELATPGETPPLRDRLQREGIACYEADVRFAMRYLIDRRIRGSLTVAGDWRRGRGVGRVYEDPEVAPGEWSPRLSVLSFDIETDPRARRLLSMGLWGCGAAEVLLLTPEGWTAPPEAIAVANEAELLRRFAQRVRELDPDVLTGWNVDDFDFPVLLRRAEELGVPLALGRGPGRVRRQAGRSIRQPTRISVPGRLVLDGIQLLRGAFVKMDDYSLDAVAREVLGEGKTLGGGGDRAQEILEAFRRDRPRLVEYNLTDARLVVEILDQLQLVELAVERSRLTGLPPDRVASTVAAFDFLYLSELGRRGLVAPSVVRRDQPRAMGGGHVLEPRPGLYRNVAVLDFKSLYPSLIRTFHLDPVAWVPEGAGEDGPPAEEVVVAPNDAAFRRRPTILGGLLDRLVPRREAAKAAGDRVASYAIKILMNSFFGVLGTPVCRFYNPEIADAITSFGRRLLRWCRDRVEAAGRPVLYGDTDSLFVETGEAEPAAARRLAAELASKLSREVADHVRSTWKVESRLEVEFERLYLRLFLPPARHGKRGARKRYAGLVEEGGERRVVFTGLEVVRRDWTDLARRAQRQLYERLFADQPVEDYLRELAAELRAGRLDDLLVYRKVLRKHPDAYTSTTPPHVAAARKGEARPGRRVAYVVTRAGPEPADAPTAPIDYGHYLDKQLQPVADPVLALLGLDFAKVVGEDRQLDLF